MSASENSFKQMGQSVMLKSMLVCVVLLYDGGEK